MFGPGSAMFVAEETLRRFAARDGDYDPLTRATAERLYARARARARMHAALNRLLRRTPHLQKVAWGNVGHDAHHRGLQTVPIHSIRGSESRCHDFDADFCPRQTHTRRRWLDVATARLEGLTLPPVQLIQVGADYVVRDGHHRISVASALGEREIEAEIVSRGAAAALT